ncbi:unnamed protein product [Cochlearia groenlandica]
MANQDSFFDHHRSIDSQGQQDLTSMTIDFLRARLLAERSVSKSARAKLDGLSDKVAELEEQLKIVTLQRKRAEQTTADVIAILEENGFTDVSDDYDSESDHESYSQTNSGSSFIRVEEMSGKSISWKGRRREPGSSDKIKDSRNRRQRGFDLAYFSSPRHRQGRSCRQVRRNESRTDSEDYKRDINKDDVQENGVCNEMLPKTSEEAFVTAVDVTTVKVDESLQRLSNSNGLENENSEDVNLRSALNNRAQVIGSFEDMEETQKQWERKFTEKQSSALDLCDVGNHSDVTDESNGGKAQAQAQLPSSTGVPPLRDTTPIANEVNFKEPFETLSHGLLDNSVTSPDKCCKSCSFRSRERDASPSEDKRQHISESLKSESSEASHSQSRKGICEHSSPTIQPPPVTRPNSRGGSFCSNATTIQKIVYPLVPMAKDKSDACDTVLTALKQAKLSLQEKVNNLHIRKPEYLSESSYPSTPGSYMNTYALPIEPAYGTKSSLPASSVGSMVEFPVSCAGLFRVPTDFSPDASKSNTFLASSSQKALVSHIPERDTLRLPGDQFFTKSFLNAGFQSQLLDTSPPLSMNERPLTTPYIDGPKLWTGFRVDGEPVKDTLESRFYKGTPSVSGSAITGGTTGFKSSQVSSTSFSLDRRTNTYTPITPSRILFPDTVVTPYYKPSVGLPPAGGWDDNLFRRE